MHVGEQIKRLRKERGMSGNALATAAGMYRANLARIERNGKGFSDASLGRVADALGVSMAELYASVPRRAGIRVAYDEEPPAEGDICLPVYDIEVSGGPGTVNPEFVETKEMLTFRATWLKKLGATPDTLRIVTVRGSSMEPTLWDGDKLAIHTGRTKIRDGRVFAIAYNNEARVKRLHLLVDGRLRISSDNVDKTRFPDEFLGGEELDRVRVIGQAVHRMGEGGL